MSRTKQWSGRIVEIRELRKQLKQRIEDGDESARDELAALDRERAERRREKENERRRKAYAAGDDYNTKSRERAKQWAKSNPERRKQQRDRDAEKNRERVKQWREDNPEKVKAQRVAAEGARRARKRGNGGDAKTANALVRRWKSQRTFICRSCRKRFGIARLHIDHIIPLAKGGQHDPANLQKLCDSCNISKRDHV